MDAVTYLKSKAKLCNGIEFCLNCPLCEKPDRRCYELEHDSPEEAIEIINKLMKEKEIVP